MPLLNIDHRAPEFSLRNQHGSLTTLAQYRGHYVLFWWYPKADTPG